VSLADDGTLVVHDAVGALQALEYGMRVCVDPAMRRQYLSLAMLLAQWRSASATPIWVPAQEAALLEQFAVVTAMRAIEANDQDFPAVLGAYLGFGDLRRRDAMSDVLYEPRVKSFVKLLRSPVPARRLRYAVERRLRKLEQVHQQRIEKLLLPEPMGVESGLAGEGVTQFTDADWPWLDRELRASGKRTDQRTAEVIELYRQCGGSRARMGGSAYVFLQRQLQKPSRLNWLVRQCVERA
jgi:hypothetical protein